MISRPAKAIPRLVETDRFHVFKWICRTNNSDLALVALQNDDENLRILKIVMSSELSFASLFAHHGTFHAEKLHMLAYADSG